MKSPSRTRSLPRSPARRWSEAVERLYSRRRRHLAAGRRLLWDGRVDTLRLSPGHIQGFIYTRDSRFVLVNIRLPPASAETLFALEASSLRIECSEKQHPGLSRFAAATLLAVAQTLRRDPAAAARLLPGAPPGGHAEREETRSPAGNPD